MLDVGAGTGRVTLDLARPRDRGASGSTSTPRWSRSSRRRAAGLPVRTVAADARELAVDGPVRARRSCRCRRSSCWAAPPGARRSSARPTTTSRPAASSPPRSRTRWTASTTSTPCCRRPTSASAAASRYSSQLVEVVDEGGRAALHRIREIVRDGRHEFDESVVRLDRVDPSRSSRRRRRPSASPSSPPGRIPETEAYLGATVVMLRRGALNGRAGPRRAARPRRRPLRRGRARPGRGGGGRGAAATRGSRCAS